MSVWFISLDTVPKNSKEVPACRGISFSFRQLREHLRRYGVESAAKSMFERHNGFKKVKKRVHAHQKFKKHGFDMLACQTVLF